MQDVILPNFKKAMAPQSHLLWLKISVFGTAVLVCLMSSVYKPMDYLIMITTLIGTIYMAGASCVCGGGLYWQKGTTAGAWTAMIIGAVLGIGSNILFQIWTNVSGFLANSCPIGPVSVYLLHHTNKFPINGIQLYLLICCNQ